MRRCLPAAKTGLVLLGLLLLTPGISRPERKKPFLDHFLHQMIQGTLSEAAKGAPAGTLSPDHLKHLGRQVAMGTRAGVPVVHVRMRLDPEARHAVERLGIKVYGRMDGYGSAIVPVSRLKELAAMPGIAGMQAVRIPTKELNVTRAEVRSTEAETAYGATGKGVIVGSIDTGVDWRQDDFRKPDGTTRIKYIWSQDDACVGTPPPAPFDFGCLYTEADINAALLGGPAITAPDADGHGTHTLGVSSGNGRSTGNGFPALRFIGMAPEADIIVVKTFPEPTDVTPCVGCFDISAGLDFIDAKAAELGEPYAINLSLGSQFGGHDGTDFDEVTIDSLIGSGIPGRAIVKSAGNERGHAIHISGNLVAGQTRTHTFGSTAMYTPLAGTFNDAIAWQLWYDGGDRLSVGIDDPTTAPCGSTVLSANASSPIPGAGQVVNNSNSGRIYIDDIGSPAPNGARFYNMEVDDAGTGGTPPAPCRGIWTLRVHADSVTVSGRYDAWIFFSSFGAFGVEWPWTVPDNTRNISVPGTAFDVTTVGGYISKVNWTSIETTCAGGPPCMYHFTASGPVGSLAWFSSSGPTRDGRLKPELSAPGSAITSSLSTDVVRDVDSTPYIDPDNQHQSLPGTSFSSPHVAGTFAQLLSLNPNLDAIDLRTLVTSTARVDVNVTPVPNNDWGYGKLDVKAAADLMVKAIPDLTASNSQTFGWTGIPSATTYNVYRGDLSLVSPTYYGSCFAIGLAAPSFTDASIPVPGSGFFYLVTGVKNGIEGMMGFRSDGTPRPNASPCP